jgi:hypothetical protein
MAIGKIIYLKNGDKLHEFFNKTQQLPWQLTREKINMILKNNNDQFYIKFQKIIWSERIEYHAMYIITTRKGDMHAILYIEN